MIQLQVLPRPKANQNQKLKALKTTKILQKQNPFPRFRSFVTMKQRLTGSLQYICATRSDILVALKYCARAPANTSCITALKRIIKYIRSKNLGILYKKRDVFTNAKGEIELVVSAWSDSDWSANQDRYSTGGQLINVSGNTISARTSLEPPNTISALESCLESR